MDNEEEKSEYEVQVLLKIIYKLILWIQKNIYKLEWIDLIYRVWNMH